MMKSDSQNDVVQKLRLALSSGTIPLDMRDAANRMLLRLDSPVRLVIIGPAGSGKSALLNFFAGREIVPADVDWPSVALSWGQTFQTMILRDGQESKIIDGQIGADIAGATPALLNVTAPLPFLESVSILEVATDGTADMTPKTIAWAVERADILLWCSQDFSTAQRELWATVPEGLKDHSFFVLTKADQLSANDELASRIGQLQDIVAEEFHSLVPIATLHAISASGSDGVVDSAVLAASGGKALIAAITHQVDLGRRSECDNAQLFLKRYELGLPVDPETVAQPQSPKLTETVHGFLCEQAASLIAFDVDNPAGILEFCVETAEHLTELLLDGPQDDDQIAAISDDVMQAADVLLLMQIESGAGPAADAVTLLIQLHRDVQASVAA